MQQFLKVHSGISLLLLLLSWFLYKLDIHVIFHTAKELCTISLYVALLSCRFSLKHARLSSHSWLRQHCVKSFVDNTTRYLRLVY